MRPVCDRRAGTARSRRLHFLLPLMLWLIAGCAPGAVRDRVHDTDDAEALGTAVSRLLASPAASGDGDEADAVVRSLSVLGPPAIPHLAKGLADVHESVRLVSIEALARIGGPDVVGHLLGALDDPSPFVRLAVVEKLGELRDKRATRPLLVRFREDPDAQVRYECLTSLGLIGDPSAVDLLVEETKNADPYVRMWAMDALCEMHDGHAPRLAVSLLSDPDGYVVEQVLRSCGDALDSPDGHRALVALALTADDFEATVWARRHLHRYVEKPPGGAELIEHIRNAAAQALAGPHRVRAALLLGDVRDPRATAPLIRALGDRDFWVRHHAAFLLGRMGDPRAVPALIVARRDRVKLVAVTADVSLQQFADRGDRRAQEALKRAPRPVPGEPVAPSRQPRRGSTRAQPTP